MTIHPSPLNMPHQPPVDYGPPMPTPDGKLIVTTIYGVEHEYLYAHMRQGWRSHTSYLSIPTATGRVHWPWAQIMKFETIGNSAEYVRLRALRSEWDNAKKAAEAALAQDDGADAGS